MGAVERLPAAPGTLSRRVGAVGLRALGALALFASPSLVCGQTEAPPTPDNRSGGTPTAEEVRLASEVEYYDVRGADIDEVVDRLNRVRLEGPDGPPSQGLTRYHIMPEWRSVPSGGACRVERLRLQVTVVVTLPRWPGVEARPAPERERWRVIEDAIRAHEFRHREIVVDVADDLAERLRGMEARGCGNLGRAVESALSVADGRLKEAHAELDRETPSRLSTGRPGG